ncbi:flagellar filament capping protein FliD [Stutzerimonas azotifigens]|uniref:flagellar filament capping protein FliD n=1 Tax=Stutzerimonas azotifigens TaxID=291995 RepID=UPI000423A0B9|nr:flagellar filament capping protein FliD [Stutzerimonas azotifigens]
MAGSTITGLGSSLDIDGLVSSLVKADTAPKEAQITRLAETTNTKLSAVGTLKSAVDTFQASLSSLKSVSSSFASLSAKSSNESVVTVSTSSGAVAGSYALKVDQLASGSKVATAVVEGGSSATFGAGSLSISVGSGSYSVSVSEGASLTDIRNAINAKLSDSAGVTANIVTDESGSRLVLSSETTGEGADISVTGSNDSLAALNVDGTTQSTEGGAGYITQAANAKFSIDGLSMTSKTNTVSNAVSGLSLTLTGTTTDDSATVSITANTEGLKTSVQNFVTAYNTLLTMTNALTKVTTGADGSVEDAGALVGDASVRTLMSSLRGALSSPSSDSGGLSVLSQLGVTTNTDGTLSVDDNKLATALEANYDSVGSFFTGSNGLLTRMDSVVSAYTGTSGILAQRQTNLNATLSDLQDQTDDLSRRADALETRLYAQFNKMDALVGQMESTRNSITSMFEAMTAQQKNS